MLFYISKNSNIDLEIMFPERGHSFLASDRAFGSAERTFRRKDTIVLPKDYIDILKSLGVVYTYNNDFSFSDFTKIWNKLDRNP